MNWPQITWIVLMAILWILVAVLHGHDRTDKWDIRTTSIGIAFSAWLLWCGGFFG